jgi:hypothetical protein
LAPNIKTIFAEIKIYHVNYFITKISQSPKNFV